MKGIVLLPDGIYTLVHRVVPVEGLFGVVGFRAGKVIVKPRKLSQYSLHNSIRDGNFSFLRWREI